MCRAVLRWSGVTLVVLLLIAAATRPALRDNETRRGTTAAAGENLNVFLVVDRSVDAGVEDYGTGESRIAGMRDDIAAVLKAVSRRLGTRSSPSPQGPRWSGRCRRTYGVCARPSRRSAPTRGSRCAIRRQRRRGRQPVAISADPGDAAVSGFTERRAVLRFRCARVRAVPQSEFDLTRGSVDGGAVLGYGHSDAIGEAALRQDRTAARVPYLHRDPGLPLPRGLPDAPTQAPRPMSSGSKCTGCLHCSLPGCCSPKSTCRCASSGVVASPDGTWQS